MPSAGPRVGNLSSGFITLQWVWLMLTTRFLRFFWVKKKDFCFKHFGKSWHRAVANESWLFLKNKQSNATYKKKNKSRKCRKVEIRAPTHFQKRFCTFSIQNEETLLTSLIALFYFFYIREAQRKKYLQNCHRHKMQNSNKRMAKFEISILFYYCMCILAKFSTFWRSWKPIFLKTNAFSYFQNREGTLWNNKTFVETQYTYRGLTRGARGTNSRALNHLGATNHSRERKKQQCNK